MIYRVRKLSFEKVCKGNNFEKENFTDLESYPRTYTWNIMTCKRLNRAQTLSLHLTGNVNFS